MDLGDRSYPSKESGHKASLLYAVTDVGNIPQVKHLQAPDSILQCRIYWDYSTLTPELTLDTIFILHLRHRGPCIPIYEYTHHPTASPIGVLSIISH